MANPAHVRPRWLGRPVEEISEAIRKRVASDPDRALEDARSTLEQARQEKRLAERHRRNASRLRFEFEEFKRNLEALGIEVILEQGPQQRAQSITNAEGGTSDHRSTRAGGVRAAAA